MHRKQSGLTLIELLVVISILAALAGLTTMTFDRAYDDTKIKLARAEIQHLVSALRQFKADTGYYPKQGLFDRDTNGGLVDSTAFPGTNATQQAAWFDSPANLMQLLEQPMDTSSPVMPWNIETARGWRGSYLQRDMWLDVGDDLISDGTGDPAVVTTIHLLNMQGIGDAFERSPVVPNTGSICQEVVLSLIHI